MVFTPRMSSDDSSEVRRGIAAARSGSTQARGEVLEICRQYLLLVAARHVGRDVQARYGASDLVQQTFLEAHRHFSQFQGHTRDDLLAWLCRILLNNVANFSRDHRQTRKREVSHEIPFESAESSGRREMEPIARTPSPGEHAIARERAEALQQALERLPELYRQAILLRNRDGRSFSEIGQIMNRSPEAARKLWARGVDRLRDELEGYL
ncbi:MAG: sigma-70 family RNA polymerase sigma factor [Planctomycetes bacterium]|nr:sigma-70 family RNA polymerase sigma factor [Planctomycetota bacterium]